MPRRKLTYYRAVAQRAGSHFELFIPQRDPELAFSYAEWVAGSNRMELLRVQYAGTGKPAEIGQWQRIDPLAVYAPPSAARPKARAPKADPRQGALF